MIAFALVTIKSIDIEGWLARPYCQYVVLDIRFPILRVCHWKL